MRAFLSGLVLMAVAGNAFAAPPPPLLGRVIGGVGENGETLPGVSKRCFVYPNQVLMQTYDASTGKGDSWAQPLNLTATYIRQVSAALVASEREKRDGPSASARSASAPLLLRLRHSVRRNAVGAHPFVFRRQAPHRDGKAEKRRT